MYSIRREKFSKNHRKLKEKFPKLCLDQIGSFTPEAIFESMTGRVVRI